MTSIRNHPPKQDPPHPEAQAKPKQRRTQYYTHGKDAEESALNDAGPGGTGTAVTPETSSTTAATETVDADIAISTVGSTTEDVGTVNATTEEIVDTSNGTASSTTHDKTSSRRPYPLQPSTPRAATSYFLFSDPQAFALPTIYNRTHYLHTSVRGKLWWDVNGDGKRGDYANATLNNLEYDYGVSNVPNIVLVSCNDDDDAEDGDSAGSGTVKQASTTSVPFNGRDATPLSQALVAQAGIYDFMQMDTIPSGRYYVMYEAPIGWRLTGNVLPLDRREVDHERGSYECIPRGGNGAKFSEMAREVGDFDQYGYCARSIGCVEIGSRSELEEKFEKLELLEDTDYYKDVIQGDTEADLYGMSGMAYTGGKMVALPSTYVLDVGLAREEWEMRAKQYADATVTLSFPVAKEEETMVLTPLETRLSGVFVDAKSFGTSVHQETVGRVLDKYLKENIVNLASGGNIHTKDSEEAVFESSGIDLFDAKMERKTKNKSDASTSLRRYLRASRKTQEKEDVIEITYSFTARGSYNPPPHDQLGYFVENSINADPDQFVRILREDTTLPFQDLGSASSTHLTVGPPATKACDGCVGIQADSTDASGGTADWATIPVSLVSLMIGVLICLFLSRRIWRRHREVKSDKDRKMGSKEFAINDIDIKTIKLPTVENDGSKVRADKVNQTKKRKKKKKKPVKRKSFQDSCNKQSVSDTSDGSNPNSPCAEEEDSSSSSSSEDSEAQRRRRRKKRKAKKESRRMSSGSFSNKKDPPTLEDLRRERRKRKKRTSKTRDLIVD